MPELEHIAYSIARIAIVTLQVAFWMLVIPWLATCSGVT